MRVTDKDRLVALKRLAVKTARYNDGRLPFGADQLRYISAFLGRFTKCVAERNGNNDPSMLMVRSMVDEYLVEITAQINWFTRVNGFPTENYLREFGLDQWSSRSEGNNAKVQVA